jgi:hypothetical protein
MDRSPLHRNSKVNSSDKLRVLAVIWVIVALFAVVFGVRQHIETTRDTTPSDVSVSGAVSCPGNCLYFGNGQYPVGTICRGGTGGGVDYSDHCYKCQASGSFQEIPESQCTVCYAQCLGDPQITQYNSGDKCASGVGSSYGIYTCSAGRWIKDDPADKCTGTCPGDGPYSLYDVGHSCYAEGQCYQCTEPGRETSGGFDQVPLSVCEQAGTVPGEGEQQCKAKCVGDVAERTYGHGDSCNAGTSSNGSFATYTCNNGTWEKATTQMCVGQSPGDRPGTLYSKGYSFEWVGKCFQCTTPGREYQGGFDAVSMSICTSGGSVTDSSHANIGTCLGDFDGSGKADLKDFSNFARYYNQDLTDRWFYDIVFVDETYRLSLQDFAVFGRNYGQTNATCEKRETVLQSPT